MTKLLDNNKKITELIDDDMDVLTNNDTFNNTDIENIDTIKNDSEEENEMDCIDLDEMVIDDKIITIIEPSKRISKNKMTRYEFVRIIGERIKQLTMGAKPMIRMVKDVELSYSEIAIEELKLNTIPFKIRRPVKNHYEIWAIEELDKKHLESLFN